MSDRLMSDRLMSDRLMSDRLMSSGLLSSALLFGGPMSDRLIVQWHFCLVGSCSMS